jgi:hypothetical protein
MEEDEIPEGDEWPREVTIRPTLEKTKTFMDEDYDEEHEGDDALLVEQGQAMDTISLESWDEMPEGYEPTAEDEREEYHAYLETKGDA